MSTTASPPRRPRGRPRTACPCEPACHNCQVKRGVCTARVKARQKVYFREYYQAHIEERRAYAKTYRDANPEQQRRWRREHHEKQNAYRRAYRERKKAERQAAELLAIATPNPVTILFLPASPLVVSVETETLPPGQYVGHCGLWQKIDATPHTCPNCGQRFFEKEPAV